MSATPHDNRVTDILDHTPNSQRSSSVRTSPGRATHHQLFGMTPRQFLLAVAVRLVAASIVGVVVYVVTGSVLWLIVALVATGAVINGVATTQHQRS
jgi:hypothetical protein